MTPQHNIPNDNPNPPDRSDIDELQAILGDRYQLQWIIGRGGMSTVWLAKDTRATHPGGRDVAIKILRPEYTENEEFRTRFRNESEASTVLDSPNVVATYDYGEIQVGEPGYRSMAFCYIVMEYVKGESLADVLSREKTLPERLVADLLSQAANGLAEIHNAGLVHRDIKPGNILITAGGVAKITDFGIAKAAEAVPLTRTGMVVGTAQYVSPEQAQGLQVGPASDVYSLGVVGYECLAGRRPFTGDSTVSVAIKHISEDPAPLPPEVNPNMRELIGICLHKNPAGRYADGDELASAIALVSQGGRPPQPHHVPAVNADHPLTEQLGAVATGPGTAVPPVQGPRPQPQPRAAQAAGGNAAGRSDKKSSAPVILLVLLAVVACAIAGYMFLTSRDQPSPQQETTTITNEVTTPSTPEYDPNTQAPSQPTVIITEEPTSEQPTQETAEPTQPTQPRTSQPPRTTAPNPPNPPSQPTGDTGGNTAGETQPDNNAGGGAGGGGNASTNEPLIEGASSTTANQTTSEDVTLPAT